MKTKTKRMLISLGAGAIVGCALIFGQSMHSKNNAGVFFDRLYNQTTTLLSRGERIYLSDAENVSDKVKNEKEAIKSMNGGTFPDGKKQMNYYLTHRTQGVNSRGINSITGEEVNYSVYDFYDESGNSILVEDELLFARTDNDYEMKGALYYTCSDTKAKDMMKNVLEKRNYDFYDLKFRITGVYLKGEEFVPECIEYMDEDEGGTFIPLYNLDKTEADMKSEGYQKYDVDVTFEYNDSFPDGDGFCYCKSMDPTKKAKMKEMFDKVNEKGNYDNMIYEDNGPFGRGFFEVSKIEEPYTGSVYYALCFDQTNTLYESIDGEGYPRAIGIFGFIIYLVEFAAVISAAAIVGAVINRKRG